ncbi:MAG: phenylalanine--tRNA ligase subunit beta [Deltaproteobacteria bacterium]|nr:phenylalanine--tRNA ligase subunit beta [Deltaproteobacteria bacterium]
MPTILVEPKDFCELLGEELDPEQLVDQLDLAKAEYKGLDEQGYWRIELNDTNRPDLWSAEGIARQLRCAKGRRRDYPFFEGTSAGEIRVDPALEDIRPYVGAFIAKGLKVTETVLKLIIQTQEKLAENFGRRRRDVAIGVYNVNKIKFPVLYKSQDPAGHSYVPLGFEESMSLADILERHPKGIEYRNIFAGCDKVPLLIDQAGLTLSMPPIINSREVGEIGPGDSDLFVEATGTDIHSVILTLNIMACDMADRGARIDRVTTFYPFDTPLGREVVVPHRLDRSLTIPVAEFSRLLGVTIKPIEVDNVLERYGCDISIKGEDFEVTPPPTRNDYLHIVDVIEDFAIARGYETFSPRMPQKFSPGKPDADSVLEDKVRDHMIGLGYEELISSILVARAQIAERMNLADSQVVEIANLMNENYAVLRNAVLPSLLTAEAHSTAAAYPHHMFEAGEVAVFDKSVAHGSRTELHLAALVAHREANLSQIHADLEFLFYQLGLELNLQQVEHPTYLPGRVAKILLPDGRDFGLLGEVNPEVLENWEIGVPASAFEINLDALV